MDKGLDLVSNHVPYTKGLLYGDIEVPASEHKYPACVLGFPGSAGSAAAPCVANTTPGLQLGKQTHKQCPGPCEPSLVVQSSAFHCLSLFLPLCLVSIPKLLEAVPPQPQLGGSSRNKIQERRGLEATASSGTAASPVLLLSMNSFLILGHQDGTCFVQTVQPFQEATDIPSVLLVVGQTSEICSGFALLLGCWVHSSADGRSLLVT